MPIFFFSLSLLSPLNFPSLSLSLFPPPPPLSLFLLLSLWIFLPIFLRFSYFIMNLLLWSICLLPFSSSFSGSSSKRYLPFPHLSPSISSAVSNENTSWWWRQVKAKAFNLHTKRNAHLFHFLSEAPDSSAVTDVQLHTFLQWYCWEHFPQRHKVPFNGQAGGIYFRMAVKPFQLSQTPYKF